MLNMDQIRQIRELYYEQGITNISQIAEITKLKTLGEARTRMYNQLEW